MRLHAILQAAELQIELGGAPGGQAIDHPLFVAARLDQAMFAEISQMFGNGNLGKLKGVLKMADAERAAGEEMENAEARFVAQAAINLHEFHIL